MTKNQEKVNNYLKNQVVDPLIFRDSTIGNADKLPLWDLIEEILTLMEEESSINYTTGEFETYAYRTRSSKDIWRHVIYYRDVSIFEVMKTLWEHREELVGQFCCTISKRVFRLQKFHEDWGLYHTTDVDEYGLVFREWGGLC